jgi:acetyl esterase
MRRLLPCRDVPPAQDLDPQAAALLREMERLRWPKLNTLTPAQARELWRVSPLPPIPASLRVEDTSLPGPGSRLPVRLYRPRSGHPSTLLVFFHGGGFVLESIDSHDDLCRRLAALAGCAILSVGYRLAPEHPFPAAVEDAYAATCWAATQAPAWCDRTNPILAVGGDSAGGNLATVICMLARDRGGPRPDAQWLAYPVTDWASLDTPSYRLFASGYGLDRAEVAWFRGHYLPCAEDALDPRASPLRADDLSGLPPALIQTAEFDVLRDEGRAYAGRLSQAGVAVQYTCYRGQLHAFYGMMGAVDAVEDALQEVALFLQPGHDWLARDKG